jgi:acyl-CoA thioesterase YciA
MDDMPKKKTHRAAARPASKDEKKLHTALRVVMMPRDANQYGSIFGGVILSYIDQAGFIEARRHGVHRWVTVSIDKVEFHAPVQVGDVVSFLTATERTGTSSVQVRVRVEAERYSTGDIIHVTEARMTMVSVNAACRPIPFNSPPTVAT